MGFMAKLILILIVLPCGLRKRQTAPIDRGPLRLDPACFALLRLFLSFSETNQAK